MDELERLRRRYAAGELTKEEYEELKQYFVALIVDLYRRGIIDKKTMNQRLEISE